MVYDGYLLQTSKLASMQREGLGSVSCTVDRRSCSHILFRVADFLKGHVGIRLNLRCIRKVGSAPRGGILSVIVDGMGRRSYQSWYVELHFHVPVRQTTCTRGRSQMLNLLFTDHVCGKSISLCGLSAQHAGCASRQPRQQGMARKSKKPVY
jgi:hypothetical protein